MEVRRGWLIGVLFACIWLPPSVALSQSLPADPSSASSAVAWEKLRPTGDTGGSLAWFNGKGDAGGACCRWGAALWGGIEGGYYWTEHIKTEGGVAGTREAEEYVETQDLVVGGRPYWESGFDRVSTWRVWAAQVYQFGHNAWVHPFAGLGVAMIRERRHGIRYRYPASVVGPTVEERVPERFSTHPAGLAIAGVKMYASRRVFVRADVMFGFREDVEEVTARFGFGVDF